MSSLKKAFDNDESLRAKTKASMYRTLADPDYIPPYGDDGVSHWINAFEFIDTDDLNVIADVLLIELQTIFERGAPLGTLGENILELADPYFSESLSKEAAVNSLRFEFVPEKWALRSFEDNVLIGMGLIDVLDEISDSTVFKQFYNLFCNDDQETRIDAFSVAIAGVSLSNASDFADFVASQPYEPWMMDFLTLYTPSLAKRNGDVAACAATDKICSIMPKEDSEILRNFMIGICKFLRESGQAPSKFSL